jgi:hypothetical protein
MRPNDPTPLRAHLIRRTKAAQDKAVESGGDVPIDTVEPLERLARLVKLCESVEPELPRRRWPIVALLVGTLAALSILLFVRIGETDIELDVNVSEVRFTLPRDQALSDVLNVAEIRISGLEVVRWPPEVPDNGAGIMGSDTVTLAAAGAAGETGSVSLAPLLVLAGTEVNLRTTGAPGRFRLSLERFRKEIRADVLGIVRVGRHGSPTRDVRFSTPRSIQLQPGADVVDLDLTLSESAMVELSSQIPVAGLSFSRIDELVDASRTMVRRLSTILSGTLYFESLSGEARQLRAAEALRFEQSTGEIRALQIEKDRIVLKFQGRVRGMSTGIETARRSIMPSYLEWLRARQGLALLWGGTLYVFGVAVAVARWWGARW